MNRRAFLRAGVLVTGAPFFNRGRFPLYAGQPAEYCARTFDLIHSSTVIDMLGLVTLDFRKLRSWQRGKSIFGAEEAMKLKASGVTVFHPAVGYNRGDIYQASYQDLSDWNAFIDAQPDVFMRIDSADDMDRARLSGRIGILLGQQNSGHFRSLDDVDAFYSMGQRVSQLSYYRNRIGSGCYDATDAGLSDYGIRIIDRMNRVGMAIDLSHCGDRTTLDAMAASRKPVLITHSNCRRLADHRRCKTDEAIRKMAAMGGVMGVTMVRTFVRLDGVPTMEDVLDHIDHVARITGIEHAGIGSDVDLDGRDAGSGGKKYDLDGVRYARKIFEVVEGMVRRGYSDLHIRMCLGANFRRVLREIARVDKG